MDPGSMDITKIRILYQNFVMTYSSTHNRLMPYMIIPGANRFITFMEKVFGASLQLSVPRSEGVIMHGELRIGEVVIMFADATEQFAPRPAGIFIYVEDVDGTYKMAMAEGATSTMPPTIMEYGYTCGIRDPFGNDWWPVKGS